MAEIIPFPGIYYNKERVGDLKDVAAPPYDIIAPEEQNALYAESPFNYVRVILNREEPGDNASANPYTRAAACLNDWLASGVLVQDTAPALYAYRQDFTNPADGARYSRLGIFCALKLEPYSAGIVLPHEQTRTKAKEDRLRLMRATQANPEPIFGLYEDPAGVIAGLVEPVLRDSDPLVEVPVGEDFHRVWRIDDENAIRAAQEFLGDKRIWIADGHHRYETGLAYRDERRAAEGNPPGPQTYDYLFIVLTAFTDPGIVVLPTHRLVKNVSPERMEQLSLQLERYFTLERTTMDALPARMAVNPRHPEHRFGMVTTEGAWVLTLRDEAVMDAAVEDHCPAWKRLDVSILQALVLDRSLGIPAAQLATTPDIAYTRDREEAVARVQSGEFDIAFLLNLPSADEVRQVASAGDKMPPKSTFFYPKQWSGLLLRKL